MFLKHIWKLLYEILYEGMGRSWIYVLLESCCPAFGMTMLPGKHVPFIQESGTGRSSQ